MNNSTTLEKPILAIDYGSKRIGLAVSDSKGLIASPLPVIHITRNKSEELVITELLAAAEKYRVKSLLIGLPQAFVASHEEIREKIEHFAAAIRDKTPLDTAFFDESFSTKGAQNMLLSLGQSRKKYKDKIDSLAAANFLKEYLDAEQRLQAKQHTPTTTDE
ncbi:MAG: Holliday junction resolvase RuvX [Candidatus Dojkabacteria bacterium]|nr:MAG: Holliday junction resolvase RuvX [Candidatus Dojkabacteria bacterium]